MAILADCQIGSAPFPGGGFGHFYAYAPEKREYPFNRYTMAVRRQLDVLGRNFNSRRYPCGDDYSVADMVVYAWYGSVVAGKLYDAGEFLNLEGYTNAVRWAKHISFRPAVKRGRRVNRTWGNKETQLAEGHNASDLD